MTAAVYDFLTRADYRATVSANSTGFHALFDEYRGALRRLMRNQMFPSQK